MIYLEDFTDEVLPTSDCSPQGWARWLAGPDRDWGRDTAASDGDSFKASVLRFEEDVIATRVGLAWTFSREPEGAQFFACRFGPGMGWAPDHICGTMDELRQWFIDNGDFCDDVEHVAVAYAEPDVMTTYRVTPDGPTLVLEPIA